MWLKTIVIPGGVTRPPDKPPGKRKRKGSDNKKDKDNKDKGKKKDKSGK